MVNCCMLCLTRLDRYTTVLPFDNGFIIYIKDVKIKQKLSHISNDRERRPFDFAIDLVNAILE